MVHKLSDGAILLCLFYYPLSLKVTQEQLSSQVEGTSADYEYG